VDDVGVATRHRPAERCERGDELPEPEGVELGAGESLDVGAPPAAGQLEAGVTDPRRAGVARGHALVAHGGDQALGVPGQAAAFGRIDQQDAQINLGRHGLPPYRDGRSYFDRESQRCFVLVASPSPSPFALAFAFAFPFGRLGP
jgi:hypothetical protein